MIWCSQTTVMTDGRTDSQKTDCLRHLIAGESMKMMKEIKNKETAAD